MIVYHGLHGEPKIALWHLLADDESIVKGRIEIGHNSQYATARLTELNGWLQVNGVDVPAFVAEVSATATAEAQPAQ